MAQLNKKQFSGALKIVRTCKKTKQGKVADKDIATMCGAMLRAVRNHKWDDANDFSKRIVSRGVR